MLPKRRDRGTRALLAIAFLLLCHSIGTQAQVFDFEKARVPMAVLNGPTRFHTGDNPHWADPEFDDSNWPVIQSGVDWKRQGYEGYSGFAWYRFRLHVSSAPGDLAMEVPALSTSYQAFVNGKLMAALGGMPPHQLVVDNQPRLFAIDAPAREVTLVIAFRIWQWPRSIGFESGGFAIPPIVGRRQVLEDYLSKDQSQRLWSNSAMSLPIGIGLLAGIAGLTLFAMRQAEREYLWFGLNGLLDAAGYGILQIRASCSFPVGIMEVLGDLALSAESLVFLLFISAVLRRRERGFLWLGVLGILIVTVLDIPLETGLISYSAWHAINQTVWQAYWIALLAPLAIESTRGNKVARILIIPNLVSCAAYEIIMVPTIFANLGFAGAGRFVDRWSEPIQWPYPFPLVVIGDCFATFSILIVLLVRFARSRREEERLAAEIDAARTVQGVLVPVEIPEVAGYRVEAVYKPAGQVGGDFFQIIPTRQGGALIVIGDVSGKGMPAAMTVSLLVGTVRTLAHYTQSPAEILAAMNQRMLARSKDGFTTCLVLRVDADGGVTAANAGHLAPYVEGREVQMENGLPLGLVSGAEYGETEFSLGPEQQLTLITDGVVEAQSKSRELFGFERAALNARERAERIADAAVTFGQQDDITVVIVRRSGVISKSPVAVGGLVRSET